MNVFFQTMNVFFQTMENPINILNITEQQKKHNKKLNTFSYLITADVGNN